MYGRAGSSHPPVPARPTEFDILKASHKFLREDEDAEANSNNANASANGSSWGDRLAQKYYDSLYREFAVCDLKHYKSGNLALRWRTEEEVLNGAGEETCGNTRCPFHFPPSEAPGDAPSPVSLKTVELPFAYEEHGEYKSALVKVVLCDSCLRKLMWKRDREKREKERRMVEGGEDSERRKERERERMDRREIRGGDESERGEMKPVEGEPERRLHERRRDQYEKERTERDRRKLRSRSRSPSRQNRRKREDKQKNHRHERSPSS